MERARKMEGKDHKGNLINLLLLQIDLFFPWLLICVCPGHSSITFKKIKAS
jgi:hypothetical protein